MATKNELRIDILVALFGDNDDLGIRDLSDNEKLFILNNSGVRAEISACLESFSHCLTPKNESWLNSNSSFKPHKNKILEENSFSLGDK